MSGLDSLDSATWQALGLVLTLLGLGLSVLVWRRRGAARGLRAVGWSLLPLAAGLTGTLRLVGDVSGAVTRWAARLALDPLTWTGIVLAGVSAVLLVGSGALVRRERSRGGPTASPATPQPGATPRRVRGGRPAAVEQGRTGDPELDEIEQLLRRRGLS